MPLRALARLKWLLASAGPAALAVPALGVVAPLATVGGTGSVAAPRYASADARPSTASARGPHVGLSLDAAVKVEVDRVGGVPLADGSACPAVALRLSYDDPGAGWSSGAFVEPLGPAPDTATTAVNGVVLCDGSRFAFAGFEASLGDDGTWSVGIVPDPAGGFGSEAEEDRANTPDTAAQPIPIDPTRPIVGLLDSASIEGYARYEAQSTCDPTPKPGTLALRNLLLARYPSTGSSGISRACDVGGRSEHKEGRAFDWRASVNTPSQRAAVDDFIAALFATDSYGHQHALARRMGVMYVIWNRQIWSAYSASAGWRPYNGSSPHTDHVHISLSWAGARAQTSFWSGTVVPGLPERATNGGSDGDGNGRRTVPTHTPARRRTPVPDVAAPATEPTRIHRSSRRTSPPPPPATTPTTVAHDRDGRHHDRWQPDPGTDPQPDWRHDRPVPTQPSTTSTTAPRRSTTTTTIPPGSTTTTSTPRSTSTTSTSTSSTTSISTTSTTATTAP